jgi:hypothetical protein
MRLQKGRYPKNSRHFRFLLSFFSSSELIDIFQRCGPFLESFAPTLISLLEIAAFFSYFVHQNQTWFHHIHTLQALSPQYSDTTTCQYLTPEYGRTNELRTDNIHKYYMYGRTNNLPCGRTASAGDEVLQRS